MSLYNLKAALLAEIATVANENTFARTKQPFAALQRFASPGDVIEHLRDSSHGYESKEPISRDLLEATQGDGQAFWRSLALLAYYPMLAKLRRQIRAPVAGDDVDQIVVQGFIEAIEAVHREATTAATSLHLRQRTRRYVFRALRTASDSQVFDFSDDQSGEDERCSRPTSRAPAALSAALHERFAELTKSDRDLVFSTIVEGVRLRDLATTEARNDNADPDRAYARLRKRRQRALRRMRDVLATKPIPELTTWRHFLLYTRRPNSVHGSCGGDNAYGDDDR